MRLLQNQKCCNTIIPHYTENEKDLTPPTQRLTSGRRRSAASFRFCHDHSQHSCCISACGLRPSVFQMKVHKYINSTSTSSVGILCLSTFNLHPSGVSWVVSFFLSCSGRFRSFRSFAPSCAFSQ